MGEFSNMSDEELVIRYANNYNLNHDAITIDMVQKHWILEKELTKQLLKSTPQNRLSVFYESYNTLYNELPWLAKSGSNVNDAVSEQIYSKRWLPFLNDIKEKKVYEIGSGNGSLITFLASKGAICTGTEISEGRPDKHTESNLEWHSTDGVNLTDYEAKESYDIVISDQVIEHLHPDDISLHFKGVFEILKPRGRYIFYTPSYYRGPGDVSLIFGTLEAEGMHLKEYKYNEVQQLLKSAGFNTITIPVNLDKEVKMLSGFKAGIFYMLEKSLMLFRGIRLRKRIYHRLIKPFNIGDEIVIIAQK
jgi:2-polyprenyl-3-methyl-5-hydroxy-6-metoxy-1,4-benzoquinol methylase